MVKTGKNYEPTFESLRNFKCPDWFRDAKFGIWSHWGPQSVPMCGDWYAKHMYVQDSPQYRYHLRHYGHPSKFGYKDICALWKAERFDPNALMSLYHKAGARYFVALAMHHDHFFNYPSKLNRMNAAQVGPMKNICGLWQEAAKKYNMPFGLTEHLAASFSWWHTNKGSDAYGPYKGVGYDGNDPEYLDFYHKINEYEGKRIPWYTENEPFRKYWTAAMKEMINLFAPDLLYSDGTLPFGPHWHYEDGSAKDADYSYGLDVVAHLYNTSVRNHGENRAVYAQKEKAAEISSIGILDVEKSQLPEINNQPWQTDTCIGNWFYDATQVYKKPSQIIEILVDVISKNGTMLLNILQRPDGTIDDEARYILNELAGWFDINSESVYGTRPWKVYGEGSSKVLLNGFREEQTAWNETDYRFVKKDNVIYAFMMSKPIHNTAVLRSFTEGEEVKSVRLLGAGMMDYSHRFGVLSVSLPDRMPSLYINCLAIKLES